MLAGQEVQFEAVPVQVRQKYVQAKHIFVLQYFPAAHEQKPVELITVNCAAKQVTHANLLVHVAHEL